MILLYVCMYVCMYVIGIQLVRSTINIQSERVYGLHDGGLAVLILSNLPLEAPQSSRGQNDIDAHVAAGKGKKKLPL